jgi:hypothetical protein
LREAEVQQPNTAATLVVHEQLLRLLGEGRPVGGTVFLDDLDLAPEHAAIGIDLIDRERSAWMEPVSEIAIVPVAECSCPT